MSYKRSVEDLKKDKEYIYETIASFVFSQALVEVNDNMLDGMTNNSVGSVYIEDVKKAFKCKITLDEFKTIEDKIWDMYGDTLLDINENETEYYYKKEKEFSLNFGSSYTLEYLYGEDEEE